MKLYGSVRLLIILNIIFKINSLKCNLCIENGLAKKHGVNEKLLIKNEDHIVTKRFVDPTFRGNPKTRAEVWARNFNTDTGLFDQSLSLIKLLNKIAIEYLNKCPPYVLYDTFVENSESYILQNLFQTFPLSFYHGKISKNYNLQNRYLLESGDSNCRTYILFLSDPLMARKIIGPQTNNKVIVVARSSQWKLQDFLSSEVSSNIVNLLVIGESLTGDPKRERPYVLYTHRLYADGLGSNVPVVLTSWIKGVQSRPHINLFPQKFANGFSGHRFLISAVNQPPFIFRKKEVDNTGTVNIFWDGLEFRLIQVLSQKLNFSFEIIEPRNTASLGSGEAVREEIRTGRADIGMAGTYTTHDRLDDIDMSVGHSKDCAAFITLASKALPKYRAIMGPFQWPVWVALTAVYLLGVFPLAYTDRLSLRHVIGNMGEIENMFWYVYGTFTNSLTFSGKYSWSNSKKLSTRLLIGFYWIFTIIITACYTGSIIAFVTLPAFPDTVDSVYDLLGLFFRVGTLDRGGWERWFANSSHEPTEKLYKKMEFVGTIEEGVGNVTASFFWNYAFLGSRAQLEYLVQSNFTNDAITKRSALHLSEECFAPFQVGYAFPKNSVYAKRINDAINLLQQNGLILKLTSEVSWAMQRSATGKLLQASTGHALREIVQEERQLTTADTEGMFLLMGAGYLIAALALISEVIGGFTNKCRQIYNRSRKSAPSSTYSSSRNSTDLGSEKELAEHLKRKAKRKADADNKPKGRFGLDELNLTKETLKELYGGYRKNEPTLIVQNGRILFETEAVSEDSSIVQLPTAPKLDEDDNEKENDQHFEYKAEIHQDVDFGQDLKDDDDDNVNGTNDFIKANIHGSPSDIENQEQLKETEVNNPDNPIITLSECIDETFGEHVEHTKSADKRLDFLL